MHRVFRSTSALTFLFLTASFFYSSKSLAYPQFIGHGYPSCLNCHFNPSGNGPLNDYGRMISATLISNSYILNIESEEKLAESSSFLGASNLLKNSWIKPDLNYRGIYFGRPIWSKSKAKWEYLHMKGDGSLTFQPGKKSPWVISGSFGYAPTPRTPTVNDPSHFRSREYYLSYRPKKTFMASVGLLDKVYGIRTPDHLSYSRTLPQVSMNDQAHGLQLNGIFPQVEYGVSLFAGNLSQNEKIRNKGMSFSVETPLGQSDHRFGISGLHSKNYYRQSTFAALHSRLSLSDGSAVLLEGGQGHLKQIQKVSSNEARYFFGQGYVRATRGLYLLTTIEYVNPNTKLKTANIRWSPGVQFFPENRIELRFELVNTRQISTENAQEDSWQAMMQMHVWL